jgi:hypothetical protein
MISKAYDWVIKKFVILYLILNTTNSINEYYTSRFSKRLAKFIFTFFIHHSRSEYDNFNSKCLTSTCEIRKMHFVSSVTFCLSSYVSFCLIVFVILSSDCNWKDFLSSIYQSLSLDPLRLCLLLKGASINNEGLSQFAHHKTTKEIHSIFLLVQMNYCDLC